MTDCRPAPQQGQGPTLWVRRPAGTGFGSPPGARSISFSAEKETGLDSKEKGGPIYGRLVGVHGGLRLYALW